MGCESTKDINEVLGPEILAANMLGMEGLLSLLLQSLQNILMSVK